MNSKKRIISLSLALFLVFSGMPARFISASLLDTIPTTFYIDAPCIGNADSFLLGKNGDFMLVDTGTYDNSVAIRDMLDKRKVTHLSALVITHYDNDHIGSYLEIIKYMKNKGATIDHIYGRKYTSAQLKILDMGRYWNYVKFINGILEYLGRSNEQFDLDALKTNRAAVDEVTVAQKANDLFGTGTGFWVFPTRTNTTCNFTLDGTVQIQWLNRWESYLTAGNTGSDLEGNVNNDSLIFKASYLGKSMLFLGDASNSALNDLMSNCLTAIDCDIIKISHHAHKYSSPKAFINAVSPKYSIATTTLDSADEPDFIYDNRLLGLKANMPTNSNIYYTGIANDFCTIAIRVKVDNIYMGDKTLNKFTQ